VPDAGADLAAVLRGTARMRTPLRSGRAGTQGWGSILVGLGLSLAAAGSAGDCVRRPREQPFGVVVRPAMQGRWLGDCL
jgi:hypothetical protein